MQRAESFFRKLLTLLPRRFRDEADSDLIDVFRDGYMNSTGRGILAQMRFWIRTVTDLLVTALAERWESRRSGSSHRAGSTRATGWFRDIRLGLRKLRRNPFQTLVASLTLGVGIAATLVVAALIKSILLNPLPYEEPERLVRLVEVDENGRPWWPSYPNLRDWRDNADFLDGVAGLGIPTAQPVILGNEAVQASVGRMMRGALNTLGVVPVVGRSFADNENAPGADPVALVSHGFWRAVLNEAPLVDLQLTIDIDQYQVVGVLPPDFRVVGEGGVLSESDVWLPMERFSDLGSRGSHGFHAIARLRSDLSFDETQTAMNRLATNLRETHGEPTEAYTVQLTPLDAYVVRDIQRPLQLLFAGSLLVLFVACLNLSATILADGLTRGRELAVRLALGAHRGALIRQLLIESTVLALPVSFVAIAAAGVSVKVLRRSPFEQIPRLESLTIDVATLVGTIGATILMAVLAGLLPAIMLSARNVSERLRSRGAGSGVQRRLWRGFIIVQAALTMIVLFASSVLIRSFQNTLGEPVGYDAEHVLSISIPLPGSRYPDAASRRRYLQSALEAVRAVPGVESAGITNVLPHETTAYISGTSAAGRAATDQPIFAGLRIVDMQVLDVLGIPLLQGEPRVLNSMSSTEALIDASLAERLWGDESPLGFAFWNGFAPELSVAGVVGPIREWAYEMGTVGAFYVDYRTFDDPDLLARMHLLVRTSVDPTGLTNPLNTALRDIDPFVPATFSLLSAQRGAALGSQKLLLAVSSSFGGIALLLAAVGVYSIVAFTARERMCEMGIRMALGAGAGRIRGETLRTGILPVIIGVSLAAVALIPLARGLASQVVNVAPYDARSFALAAGTLLLAAVIAADIPARRATKLDPVSVLDDA